MELRFIEPDEQDLARLKQLIAGVLDGTIVHPIREKIQRAQGELKQAVRECPTDQKALLALDAEGQELEALIDDGDPEVLIRLLENPHLIPIQVYRMLEQRALPSRVLSALRTRGGWLSDEKTRRLFCVHPQAALEEVLEELRRLPSDQLRTLTFEEDLRPEIKDHAVELRRHEA